MRIHRLALLLSAVLGSPAIAEEPPGPPDPKAEMREAAIEKADLEPPPPATLPDARLPQRAAPVEVERRDPGPLDADRERAGKHGVENPSARALHELLRREVHRVAVEEAVRAAMAAPVVRADARPASGVGRANGRAVGGGGELASGAAQANRARVVRESGSPGGKPPWANPGNGGGNGKGGRP